MTILDHVGRTRLLPLPSIASENGARILLKLEMENPTGSMKDRMALAMVQAAQDDGRLQPGGSVVEYTGGSTGVSLAFVCAAKGIPLQIVGTCGSLRGVSTCLRGRNDAVHVVAVEPEESAVLSGRPSGSHKIEGTGAGFVVPLWQDGLADEIQTISTREAMATARTLARQEGVFAGTSTGANVAVALRVAERLDPEQTVVTLAVDSGMKYLSTKLYADA